MSRSLLRQPRAVLRSLTAVAVLALVATGCSDAAPPGPAAGAPGAFPVTLTHAYGQTTVPAEPARVVAVGYNEADFVLSLGVIPVASREFLGGFDWQNRPWARDALGGQRPEPLDAANLPVEKVAQLQPDLIMGVYSFVDRSTYDRLSRIAPTVAQPTPDGEDAATWQEQTRITGQALGRTQRAEQVIAATEQRFAAARAAHPNLAGKRLAIDFRTQDSITNLGTDDLRAQAFAGLGMRVPATSTTLSPERQGELDADVIAVLGRSRAEAMADPVFAAIPAVREGRVAFLSDDFTDEFAGALGYSSPLSLPYAVDVMAPKLDAATRGQTQG